MTEQCLPGKLRPCKLVKGCRSGASAPLSSACLYTEALWLFKSFFGRSRAGIYLAKRSGSSSSPASMHLQYAVYADDPNYFLNTLDKFMTICAKHKIKFMPALFDDCSFGITSDPKVGKQPEPLKGWYAWAWSPSPGHSMVTDTTTYPKLEKYVTAVIARFKNDPRILLWDLYNEPTNGGLGSTTFPLLKRVVAAARKVAPDQPISVDVWNNDKRLNDIVLASSDVITFHNYGNKNDLQKHINELKKYNRPLICTEWMNRPNRSVISDNLPVFYNEKVGCMLWGLVNGKDQTELPWGHRPGDPPPAVWQHDLYKGDFSPYHQPEIDSIRMYTSKSSL